MYGQNKSVNVSNNHLPNPKAKTFISESIIKRIATSASLHLQPNEHLVKSVLWRIVALANLTFDENVFTNRDFVEPNDSDK